MFRRIINEIKNIVLSVKKDTEFLYRQFYLKNDINITRNVIAFVSLIIVLFSYSDYLIFKLNLTFFLLLIFRILLFLIGLIVIRHLSRLTTFRSYDKACILWMLTISLAIIAVNSTRPENILPQILILEIGILVSYLIIPTRFVFQVITAAVSSIGQFALMLTALDTQVLTTNQIIIFSILFSNIIGAVTSWQIHSYRWKLFQNHVKTKQSERLVAIGQTAGMVGHDIRNPLQAIVSDLYLLSDDVQSIPQTENRQSAIESIEAMNENLNYINKIVSDLQDYSRAAKPQIEEVDLSALIKKTLDKLNPPQNIKLDSTLRPDVKIDADSAHLKRIMINLLTNAIQAMPNGGALTIAMESIDNVVRIIISDTGDGIPEGTREKIFTPLFTTKAKGQGLGLAVVKKLVEELHGSINFESQIGYGTKFTITLPCTQR